MATTQTPEPRTRRFSIARVLTVAAVLGMTLLWIWILSGAPKRRNPDYLHDRAWVAKAGERCTEAVARIDELPEATTAATPQERVETVEEANAVLVDLVADLRADEPEGSDDNRADDRRVVKLWLDDWDRFLEARVDYAERLRAYDPDGDTDIPRFLLPENQKGDGIDRPIKSFADVNEIPQCATPGDVG
jgi:hypothetical protein